MSVEGLVEKPVKLTLEQVLGDLATHEQSTRMKCVEGWSSRAEWRGFTFAALAELVQPKSKATHLEFRCADGYWETLPLEELRKDGALFATHMNGQQLPAVYGSPVRMLFPWLYGYKGAKALTTVKFTDSWGKGFWSQTGNYSVEGEIQGSADYALDLERLMVHGAGQITDY